MNVKASKPARLHWKKILIFAVLVLIAGYKWYTENSNSQPNRQNDVANVDDSRYEAKLPSEFEVDAIGSTETASSSATREKEFLEPLGNNRFRSPAGLIYGMGSGGEHRIDHVMRHARDDPGRPAHGVFEGDRDSILQLLDEAYEMVKSRSKYVKSEPSRGNTAYTISMGREVGYDGGQKGKRNNHRSLKSIRLVLDENRVITAYPYR